jgi:PKD repeat protein
MIGPIEAPLDPGQISSSLNTSASFSDPGKLDTHTATWDWGDNSTAEGNVIEANSSGSVTGSHIYTNVGVYTVTLTVSDHDGGSSQSIFQYIVIFDPSAGFVTGGGWINSPLELVSLLWN